ncbi:MAG: sigma-70 family RNA polymerase sigma factor [Sandaracinaceae bacterium]
MSFRVVSTTPARQEGPRSSADPLASLASAAAGGDAGAIRTLVVSLTPALLRAVRGVLGAHHPEVEDVTQEAALGLVRALPEFRRECTVTHFACRIAVLGALAARRRLRNRGEGKHDATDVDGIAIDRSPADAVVAARRRAILRELCDELPASQSEALVLHVMLGMTVEEVASAAAAPPNTIRSRLRLGKEALRARIAGDPHLSDALEVGR